MKLDDLKPHGLFYLATPYTKFAEGPEAAWVAACHVAAALAARGCKNFVSPIVHGHPISVYGDIDPLDLDFWIEFDGPLMAACGALVVAALSGWEGSSGIRHEMRAFVAAGKPVFFLDPATLAVEPLLDEERAQLTALGVAA